VAENKVSIELTIEEKQAIAALRKLTSLTEDYGKETIKTSKVVDNSLARLNKSYKKGRLSVDQYNKALKGIEVKKLKKAFESGKITLNEYNKSIKAASANTKKMNPILASFTGNLAAIGTTQALTAVVSGLRGIFVGTVEAAAQVEKLKTQFEVLTGSQEKSAKLFQELTDFSASTPFQLNNIAEASGQLLAFGFAADSVTGRIEKIGEVAAGSNSDLKEVALIYGQVAAAGKLTGERLLQLQERAIPIGSALAKSLGVAESEVKELVSSGVVGFKEFEEAFNSMSESGGLFEGAIDKQSKTINGSLSTLADNFEILKVQIGETFAPSAVAGIKLATELLRFLGRSESDTTLAKKGIVGLRKEIKALEFRAKSISENKFNLPDFLLGDADETNSRLADYKSKLATITSAEENLVIFRKNSANALLSAQEALTGRSNFVEPSPQEEDGSARVEKEKEISAQVLEERIKHEGALSLFLADKRIKETEAELAQKELVGEDRVAALEELVAFETAKADATFRIDKAKNSSIKDADARATADMLANAKRQTAITEAQGKAEKKINDARVKAKSDMINSFATIINKGVALSKEGTAEHKALSIAAATISTYTAASRAMVDYPYPANIGVAALTVASGLKNVKQITNASFAHGGVVGGFTGATSGNDNQTVNARTGEMFLNAPEQRRLFDIASGKAQSSNSSQAPIEVTSIVEIDGREIARAVRTQKQEGFA